jgi:MFS family permease
MSLLSLDSATFREHSAVRVWRNRGYSLYMSGLAPYYVTFWMQRIAVGWLAWELTHSHAWVGAVAAAELAPMIVLGPLAGALADRANPLRQTRWAQLMLSIQALVLAAATVMDAMTAWLLLVLSLIAGAIHPIATAARQLVVPATIPRSDYASAISLDSSLFHGSRFVGPALAAFTIPTIGVAGTLITHVVGSLIFYLAVTRLQVTFPERPHKHGSGIWTEIRDGFRYASRHRGLAPLFLLLTACSLLARPLQELLPGFAGGVFMAGASGLAWLTSAMGIGSMAAAIFLAARGGAHGLTYLSIVSAFGLAVSTFGMVATQSLAYAVMFATLFGFTLTLMGVGIQAMAQIAVDDAMRGRVMIIYVMIYRGLPALGALLIGVLAEQIGLRSAFALAALACVLAWLIAAARHREIDRAMTDKLT